MIPIQGSGKIYSHFFLESQKKPTHISYHANSGETVMRLFARSLRRIAFISLIAFKFSALRKYSQKLILQYIAPVSQLNKLMLLQIGHFVGASPVSLLAGAMYCFIPKYFTKDIVK
jgi:hypothetical protein